MRMIPSPHQARARDRDANEVEAKQHYSSRKQAVFCMAGTSCQLPRSNDTRSWVTRSSRSFWPVHEYGKVLIQPAKNAGGRTKKEPQERCLIFGTSTVGRAVASKKGRCRRR
ncbi:hypothetical protein FOQG_10026 [Fusarium oxysporum f. sp. raphani 54005]|uniref:Uncharacterized protein n=2 Tax=Fusarium oxysporum TaxID=5507 RepID=X0C457_FUSOX|nr:hypothetical protein FOVG_09906 [Fusarium oxysporum f. sp. pisi HDV247]EXK85963.1 hypothetical protein FOQG_10026 [Fusarium oxysporum f. sp. raphani 54005]